MKSLWDCVAQPGATPSGYFHGRESAVPLAQLAANSSLEGNLEQFRGRAVLLAAYEQLPSALALLELDGIAKRIVLCTPDLTPEQLGVVARTAAVEIIVSDDDSKGESLPLKRVRMLPKPSPAVPDRHASENTEWILLTSGTTGTPKLVAHTLESLAGSLPRQPSQTNCVWSTFYDIRRYGGLQIYLRAVMGGAPLVLSSPGEGAREFLTRAASGGVTHMSGTPSHWRRALMSGAAAALAPAYVRLSGEVADQPLLDSLRTAFPQARVAHAFASTEAGVAFEVNDGIAGFPATLLGAAGAIELKVEDGTLRIRSKRNATRYLGEVGELRSGNDGFVDTGDMVELVEGRYQFRGRKGGVINVGGLKVYPEEIEAVLNADPRVRMSLVRARRNPITGAVVVADVVLAEAAVAAGEGTELLKRDLLNICRNTLAAHKVPAVLRFVPALDVNAAGKLVRPGA